MYLSLLHWLYHHVTCHSVTLASGPLARAEQRELPDFGLAASNTVS
jgi:hypothetical protein